MSDDNQQNLPCKLPSVINYSSICSGEHISVSKKIPPPMKYLIYSTDHTYDGGPIKYPSVFYNINEPYDINEPLQYQIYPARNQYTTAYPSECQLTEAYLQAISKCKSAVNPQE